jgi:hypothetical protein
VQMDKDPFLFQTVLAQVLCGIHCHCAHTHRLKRSEDSLHSISLNYETKRDLMFTVCTRWWIDHMLIDFVLGQQKNVEAI